MEEKKTKSKEIKMTPVNSKEEQSKKLTYEQLNQAAAELSQQVQNQNAYIQQLRQQLQQVANALQSKRIEFLFKVLALKGHFSEYFIKKCAKEIEESLTIPEVKEEDNKASE